MLRTQLPAYSPISLGSWVRGVGSSIFQPSEIAERLRANLIARFGAEDVILTDSGTHALELALRLVAGRHPTPGPVALPAYSCFDLATAALGARVPVRFYDVDPASLTPDLDQVRSSLAAGARVVVVSNLFGFPVDWDALEGLCEGAEANLIEDAAQGLGSFWRGRPGGTFGNMTVLSFGRGKGWTGGGGGALLLREGVGVVKAGRLPTLARPTRMMVGRSAALSLAQWALGRPWLYGFPAAFPWLGLGRTTFKEPSDPRGMSTFSAGLAIATENISFSEVSSRKEMAETIRARLSSVAVGDLGLLPDPIPGGESSFLRVPFLAERGADALLQRDGARALGLARGYHKALHQLPQIFRLGLNASHPMPGAEEMARRLLTLPTHSLLSEADLDRILALFS